MPGAGVLLVQQPPVTPAPSPAPAPAPPAQPQQADVTSAAGTDLTTAPTEAGSSPPELLGDVPPFPIRFLGTVAGHPVILPSARGFKVADNESPEPRDRAYFSFNFFDDLYGAPNHDLGAPVRNVRVFRETFGLEKTCLDGAASVGLRLPLNSFLADSAFRGLSSNSTDVGDLSVILKATVCRSADNSRLLSAGLAVTAPTGPDTFANDKVGLRHNTTLQPFVGYLWAGNNCYVQGFTAIDAPTGTDLALLFNDVGLGYFVYRAAQPERFLTALAPTLEVHVNTPLNHRGGFTSADLFRMPDLVDLTAGVNLEFARKTRLAIGVVAPVTGPKPFDVEVIAQFRCRF
jgi:hypothetical protein